MTDTSSTPDPAVPAPVDPTVAPDPATTPADPAPAVPTAVVPSAPDPAPVTTPPTAPSSTSEASTPPPPEGFLERLEGDISHLGDEIGGFIHRAEADAAPVIADVEKVAPVVEEVAAAAAPVFNTISDVDPVVAEVVRMVEAAGRVAGTVVDAVNSLTSALKVHVIGPTPQTKAAVQGTAANVETAANDVATVMTAAVEKVKAVVASL